MGPIPSAQLVGLRFEVAAATSGVTQIPEAEGGQLELLLAVVVHKHPRPWTVKRDGHAHFVQAADGRGVVWLRPGIDAHALVDWVNSLEDVEVDDLEPRDEDHGLPDVSAYSGDNGWKWFALGYGEAQAIGTANAIRRLKASRELVAPEE